MPFVCGDGEEEAGGTGVEEAKMQEGERCRAPAGAEGTSTLGF